MKITRSQLRRIIKEEKAKILREAIAETPGQESPELRQAAAALGSLMAGQPPTAHAVADALKDRYPGAAKDLLAAYEKAQTWIDAEYMDW
jgi:ABC-type nitrate/sulfonate/bicarbonate transport system substrate-binding protein